MKLFFTTLLVLFVHISYAQCPVLQGAMVNACNAAGPSTEGTNEFVIFRTTTDAIASNYKLNYGSANPPNGNALSGVDATIPTGTGQVQGDGGCNVIYVTTPGTSIPLNSQVMMIPANFTQDYDVTGVCSGGDLYVILVKTNANGGTQSNWTAGGTMSNSATTPRYLQITNSASASCGSTTAPVQNYTATNWTTNVDGNFVSWNESGTTTYSNNGCDNFTLPVSLLHFTASNTENGVSLNWQIAVEENTSHYELQRATDGNDFSQITSINSQNSSVGASYNYEDIKVPAGTIYYRLKMIDRDGRFTYSAIAQLEKIYTQTKVAIFTNPVRSQLPVTLSGSKEEGTLSIFSSTGSLVKTEKVQINGSTVRNIDINNLPAGLYVLQFRSTNLTQSIKFVKQ